MMPVSSASISVRLLIYKYCFSKIDVSEDDVQAQLDKEETEARKASGTPALHTTSASAFLSMGLELEESQYVHFHF